MSTPDSKSAVSKSDSIISEQATRLEEECQQLLSDIKRIGEPGEPHVLFGDLFDDDQVANYYEALVGTLKSAKKAWIDWLQGTNAAQGSSW